MAALNGEQLTLMLKTINDAGNANATAIATLYQSIETLRSPSMLVERAWQVVHEELHATGSSWTLNQQRLRERRPTADLSLTRRH